MSARALIVLLAACGGGDAEGTFTQSVCPPTDPPTYASFGQLFMETYCTECHDSAKTGAMRQDAPPTIDFDSLALLRMWTSQIDKQAAFGPAGMNRIMPPDGNPKPTDDERRRLGEFIACEVAK
jgi:uncharacterized membrane protein